MRRLGKLLGIGRRGLLLATAATLAFAMVGTTVSAQEITSSVTGTVLQPDGSPAAGVTATIIDSRDGGRRSVRADNRGVISFRSISAGGPYTRITGASISAISYSDTGVTGGTT